MNICRINKEKKELVLSLDYWEAESLGYDVINDEDRSGTYYSLLLRTINDVVVSFFGREYHYGIKTYRNSEKGIFYFYITPYENRMAEILLEDMLRKHYIYDYDTQTLFHF